MKKEQIYKLVEKGFDNKNSYLIFVTKFIKELKNEGYFEMADVITNIKNKNTTLNYAGQMSKQKNKTLDEFGPTIKKQVNYIREGFNRNIIMGIILHGAPGTGKTEFVNRLSKLLGLNIAHLKIASIMDARFGESLKRLDNFMESNISSKQIIFVDEAESLFSKRGKRNDVFESDRILTLMLQKLDQNRKALIIFATNLYDTIDPAIIRRFDMKIDFDENVINIKKVMTKNIKKYLQNVSEEQINEWSEVIKIKLIKPRFSDLNIIAKKIALEILIGHEKQIDDILDVFISEVNSERKGGKNE